MPAIASASDLSASSRRSVLKTLNSLSSAVNPTSLTAVASTVAASSNPRPSTPFMQVDRRHKRRSVGREVLHDLERGGERRDGHDVRRRQPALEVVPRCLDGALQLLRLHGAADRTASRSAGARAWCPPARPAGRGSRLREQPAPARCLPSTVGIDGAAISTALASSSSNPKVEMACGRPSSVTVKSSRVRPRTIWPFLSRTTTLTSTRSTPDWNVGRRWASGGLLDRRRQSDAAASRGRRRGRQPAGACDSMSSLHGQNITRAHELHAAHRPDAGDLAERRRVHHGVDRRPLGRVKHVVAWTRSDRPRVPANGERLLQGHVEGACSRARGSCCGRRCRRCPPPGSRTRPC